MACGGKKIDLDRGQDAVPGAVSGDPPPIGPVDISGLPRAQLERMYEAGLDVIECHRVLAKTGDNIVGEFLKLYDEFVEWDHYPAGDVWDYHSHSQFYYHAHPPEERPGEHGHFHTFLRPKGMPEGVTWAPLEDADEPEGENDALCHLIAVSMDSKGFPRAFFTVNRWVTGDWWYTGEDVVGFIDLFEMDTASPSWPVNRWITGMFRLFRPQLEELIRVRDRSIADWEKAHPDVNVYCDHDLEVTSQMLIDIDVQMAAIQAALDAKG